MRIEGAFHVDAPPEVVWHYITDPAHVGDEFKVDNKIKEEDVTQDMLLVQ